MPSLALVGRGPDFYVQIGAPTLALDNVPVVPDALPADLLGRRADLLAGRARIEAALAGRDIAKAEFLPNVNIVALFGTLSLGLDNAFKGSSTEYGVGPAIHLPIFEGGRLKANYKGTVAGIDESIAAYNGSVLSAVRDAADAVTGVQTSDRDLAAQRRIVSGLRGDRPARSGANRHRPWLAARRDRLRLPPARGGTDPHRTAGGRVQPPHQADPLPSAAASIPRLVAQAATPAGKKQS